VQVWKRAIAEYEEKLSEMNRVVSAKMAQQQQLIDKLQQYVRLHGGSKQRVAPSAAVDNNISNTEEVDDEIEKQQPDELSIQLSAIVDSLKAMTADSVQVSYCFIIIPSVLLSSSRRGFCNATHRTAPEFRRHATSTYGLARIRGKNAWFPSVRKQLQPRCIFPQVCKCRRRAGGIAVRRVDVTLRYGIVR